MSTGSSHANTSAASRPIFTPGAQRNFKTWSSLDQELAARNTLAGNRVFPSVARVRSQEDRALFPAISALKPAQLREALLNVLFIGGAVSAIIIMATILLLVPYWVFFVES